MRNFLSTLFLVCLLVAMVSATVSASGITLLILVGVLFVYIALVRADGKIDYEADEILGRLKDHVKRTFKAKELKEDKLVDPFAIGLSLIKTLKASNKLTTLKILPAAKPVIKQEPIDDEVYKTNYTTLNRIHSLFYKRT